MKTILVHGAPTVFMTTMDKIGWGCDSRSVVIRFSDTWYELIKA